MQKDTPYSENALMQEIRNSNVDAFKELYYRYYEPLGNYIFNRINSEEQTKDITQDIFAWIWQNREKVFIKTSLSAYLYRMAFNKTVNLYIKNSHRKSYILKQKSKPDLNSDNTVDLRIDIKNAVHNLPIKIREVFILSRFEGLKNNEIAQVLNLSVKTVESRITKALKRLRILLR